MNEYKKEDIIKYRIARAFESLDEANLLAKADHWNTVANRLYYSCFYIVKALLIKNDISASTHSGVKSQFFKHFIKTEILNVSIGKLFSDLSDKRQEGDYQPLYYFDKESIFPLIEQVKSFINAINEFLSD